VRASPHKLSEDTVFLNIPYDRAFRRLYLAYITGLAYLGLDPRATVQIPSGRNRLEKILELIRSCRYSIHDLSRVELDRTPPATPRFNMPFELGLAVASAEIDFESGASGSNRKIDGRDSWFVFEARKFRLAKSLSDLRGTDPRIHGGTVEGVMRELGNTFLRRPRGDRYSVGEMMKTYRAVRLQTQTIIEQTGAQSLFEARMFRLLCTAARAASH